MARKSLPASTLADRLFEWALESEDSTVEADNQPPDWTQDAPMMGAYRLEGEIGRGGMGVIYRAVHCVTHEVVALKTLLPRYETRPETLARFRREAQAAQSLEHPHCMPVFEVGVSDQGAPFFTMLLAPGGSLQELSGKFHHRWRQIAQLMVKVADAVSYAHGRGVLHRDIKPGNILFTEDYEPLVADFGLAKPLLSSGELTRSCEMLGTPSYVAPEQAAGKTRDLTMSADVYSLGAVLFELLTGRSPHIGDNSLDVLQQIGKQPITSPRRLDPAVPQALDVFACAAWKKFQLTATHRRKVWLTTSHAG